MSSFCDEAASSHNEELERDLFRIGDNLISSWRSLSRCLLFGVLMADSACVSSGLFAGVSVVVVVVVDSFGLDGWESTELVDLDVVSASF